MARIEDDDDGGIYYNTHNAPYRNIIYTTDRDSLWPNYKSSITAVL